MNSNTKTILVEGNIGSGKTTYLSHLKHNNDLFILEEPIKQWQNCNGVNLLDKFYNDAQHWGMPFQTYVIMTLLDNHIMKTDKPYKIMERSLYSSEFCFIKNMQTSKILDESLFTIIDKIYRFIDHNVDCNVDAIGRLFYFFKRSSKNNFYISLVYIRTSPQVVYERMLKRARFEEKCVPLEYLMELHDLHEKWLVDQEVGPKNIPVIILNGDLDECDILEEYKRVEQLMLNV